MTVDRNRGRKCVQKEKFSKDIQNYTTFSLNFSSATFKDSTLPLAKEASHSLAASDKIWTSSCPIGPVLPPSLTAGTEHADVSGAKRVSVAADEEDSSVVDASVVVVATDNRSTEEKVSTSPTGNAEEKVSHQVSAKRATILHRILFCSMTMAQYRIQVMQFRAYNIARQVSTPRSRH